MNTDKPIDVCPLCLEALRLKYGKPVVCKCGYDWKWLKKPDEPQPSKDS